MEFIPNTPLKDFLDCLMKRNYARSAFGISLLIRAAFRLFFDKSDGQRFFNNHPQDVYKR
jgi:hypothetical protein